MTTKNFFLLYAIIIIIYGIIFLFLPNQAYELYGLTGESTPLSTNLLGGLGSVFIPAGIMAFLAKDASASHGRKAILVFITLSSLIFLIRNIMGMASGVSFGNMTYVDLIIQAIFVAGGIYFIMKEKGSA